MMLRDRRWDPIKDKGDQMWGRLNEAWRDLITLAQAIPNFSIYERTFTGPTASLASEVGGSQRPIGVMLIDIMETTTASTAPVTFSWVWSDGVLTSTSFSAIAAGTYRLRLLVIGGA